MIVSPTLYFYPRSPCGERPSFAGLCKTNFPFLSTLSLRRATERPQAGYHSRAISIHALLAESDTRHDLPPGGASISIHALLAESDTFACWYIKEMTVFLSTLSLRRATCSFCPADSQGRHFYPRSPCGERRAGRGHVALRHQISIHALLAESDLLVTSCMPVSGGFLSTLSLRRATPTQQPLMPQPQHFYPRSPCGERLTVPDLGKRDIRISIHALLAESDARIIDPTFGQEVFLSTLSLRRATGSRRQTYRQGEFLSTLSLRRATAGKARSGSSTMIFLSTLSLRRATTGPG